MRQTLILVAIFTARVACVAQEVGVEKLPIQPEPSIQEQFDKVIDALNNSPDPPQDNIEARREIKDLKDSVADKSDIVEQLIVYAAGPDEEQPLKALMILHLLDLPPKIIIPELAPYLNDDDIKVSSFVSDWFQSHDNVGPSKDYVDYVSRRKEDIPNGFVEYLFERSPNEAFLVFVRAEPKSNAVKKIEALRKKMDQQRPGWDEGLPQARAGAGIEQNELLLAEHIISNAIWLRKYGFHDRFPNTMREAKQQLSQLSEHNQWWARLYVAEIMKRHRELRQAEVLEKLSRDSNELVSKPAKSAKETKQERDKDAAVSLVAPRNVEARAIGAGSIRVDWQASVGATSYDVQRSRPDSEKEFTTIARGVKETTYTDHTDTPGVLYEYRVVAKSAENPQRPAK